MTAQCNEMPNFDVQATADAPNLLARLRWQHVDEIPLSVWRMMNNAEKKLNKELREYLVPKDESLAPPIGNEPNYFEERYRHR